MFSKVWGDKGIGNIVKKICFGTVYGDKCVNYIKLPCFEGKHCKNMQTHFKKHGIWRILWKNMQITDNGAKCRLESFSGRRRRGYLKFLCLGGPHAGEKINRGPGRPGLRMAAKLFETEMQITCTNV